MSSMQLTDRTSAAAMRERRSRALQFLVTHVDEGGRTALLDVPSLCPMGIAGRDPQGFARWLESPAALTCHDGSGWEGKWQRRQGPD